MRRLWTLALLAGALTATAETNYVWIPYMHPGATQWWTNVYSLPDEVTNWQGWQAVDENFRRASNRFASVEAEIESAGGTATNLTVTLSGDVTGSGTTSITVTVTNIQPPGSGSVGQVLTRTTTGVGFAAPTGLGAALTNNWAGGSVAIDAANAKTNTYGGLLTILGEQVQSGYQTVASGSRSHAEGRSAIALGSYSHAEGYLTTANGSAAHAEGFGNSATNTAAHAEGYQTVAAGLYSHAEGQHTEADGLNSHAAGQNSTTTHSNAWVWSDGTTFGSTTTKQFSAYAANGFRFLGGSITGNGSGLTNVPSSSISGLADAQTNSVLNSFRVPWIVSNNIVISAGATNILGWVTNLAGVVFTYPNVTVTNTGWWTTNGPLLLYSFDGNNWNPGLSGLVTNVAVQIGFYSGSMFSNPPSMQIPLPGYVTNFVAYKLVRPDLFGLTNATFGQTVLVQDPTQPQQAASKNYVDSLLAVTPWWNAGNDVQLNGFNFNLSSTWQEATEQTTNSVAYHLRFLNEDVIKATMSAPVSAAISSVTITNSTNVVVKVPTNGLSSLPRLELSRYLVPPVWSWLTNTAEILTTNYVWTFPVPYADSGFLLAVVPSTNPTTVLLNGLLSIPSRTITNSTASTYGYSPSLICADSNYVYVSVGSNLWKRAALASW